MYSLLTQKAEKYIAYQISGNHYLRMINGMPYIFEDDGRKASMEYLMSHSNIMHKIIAKVFGIYDMELNYTHKTYSKWTHYEYTNINDKEKILTIRRIKEWPARYYILFSFNGLEIRQDGEQLLLLLFLDPLLFIQKMREEIPGTDAEDFFTTLEYNINKKVAYRNTSFLLITQLRHILVIDVLNTIMRLYIILLRKD